MPTKLRPCRPRSSQGTSESGLPDRSAAVGCTAPSSVPPSLTLKAELTASTRPWNSTPFSTKITSTVDTTTASGRASFGGRMRPASRVSPRVRRRTSRPIPTNAANASRATTTVPPTSYAAGSSSPMSRWISSCQRCPSQSMTIPSTVPRTASTCQARRRTAGEGRRSVRARTNHATVTPSPYPIAAVIPAINPWINQPRGSNEGVNEL